MKTPTIYEIKADYYEHNPQGHYFDRATLKWFGQTLRDFHVNKTDKEGVFYLWAKSRCIFGNVRLTPMQTTKAYYDMSTHKIENASKWED